MTESPNYLLRDFTPETDVVGTKITGRVKLKVRNIPNCQSAHWAQFLSFFIHKYAQLRYALQQQNNNLMTTPTLHSDWPGECRCESRQVSLLHTTISVFVLFLFMWLTEVDTMSLPGKTVLYYSHLWDRWCRDYKDKDRAAGDGSGKQQEEDVTAAFHLRVIHNR